MNYVDRSQRAICLETDSNREETVKDLHFGNYERIKKIGPARPGLVSCLAFSLRVGAHSLSTTKDFQMNTLRLHHIARLSLQ